MPLCNIDGEKMCCGWGMEWTKTANLPLPPQSLNKYGPHRLLMTIDVDNVFCVTMAADLSVYVATLWHLSVHATRYLLARVARTLLGAESISELTGLSYL